MNKRTRSERRSLILAVLLTFALVLSACGTQKPSEDPPAQTGQSGDQQGAVATPGSDSEPRQGGTLDVGVGSEPLSFDPPNYKATTDLLVSWLIMDGLVAFDNDMKIVPSLATRWEQIDDLTWRFELRQGVKFSDGTDFNAEDVKASLERGATKPRGKAFIGFVAGVNIIGDYTVDVKLTNPFGPFLSHMATPVAVITSAEHLATQDDDGLMLNPVGTGPFKLKDYVPKQKTLLVPNENYWGEAPYLDEVAFHLITDEATRFAALRSGQLDVIESPPPHESAAIEQDPNLVLLKTPATRDLRLGFQVQDKVLKDPKVREAIARAIDSKSIVEFVVEGLARHADSGWLPPEVMPTDPPLAIEYDPEKSKQLLADAGYANGLTLELVTPVGRYLRDKEIAEAVQQQLSEVGITVKIKVLEWAQFLDTLSRHESQLFILGWGMSTGDPAVAARQNWHSGDAFNWANLQDAEIDRLITEAEQTSDQAKRQQLYWDMQKRLLDNYALKPIYWKYNLFAAQSKVKNFVAHPLELMDVTKTWIEE